MLTARQVIRSWGPHSMTAINHQNLAARPDAVSIRCFTKSSQQSNQPKGFLARVIENIRSEFSENKEIKENLEKFRRETQKLEETEALKQAREKYKKVEAESVRDVNEVLQTARDSLRSGVEKAKEAEIVKKTIKIGETIGSSARGAADGISRQGEILKETTAYKKVSQASKTVEKELDNVEMLSSLYESPQMMTRAERSAFLGTDHMQRNVMPNEEAQSVELHKDSKWSQNWNKFKEDNPYVNKVFEIKMRYDESDNAFIRVTRNIVDRVTDSVSGLFQKTDLSQVLTEICKVDSNFDINVFLRECEKFVIPTILEAMCQNRIDILTDWCHEAVFNVLIQSQKEASKLGLKIHSKILDIQNLELVMGKIMDQGPVLVVSFQAQQVTYVADVKGNVVEGEADKVIQNTYVMAFCRDQTDLDPNTAWRLIDVAMQQSQFMF